jgi:hypothetical protein
MAAKRTGPPIAAPAGAKERKPRGKDAAGAKGKKSRARLTRSDTPTRAGKSLEAAAKLTAAKKSAMIVALGKVGNVRGACILAKISRQTHYEWLGKDAEYGESCYDAFEDFADKLEAEVFRRGVVGDDRPIMYKGEKVGEVRERSDMLLLAALKALRPEKYRERFDVNLSRLSDDELLQIAREKGIDIRQRGDQRAIGPAPSPTEGTGTPTEPKPN